MNINNNDYHLHMKPFFLVFCFLFVCSNIFANEVNVYSYRKPHLVEPLFNKFEKDTGIKVNTVFAEKGIVQRLKNEGKNSPADLIFTVDIGSFNAFAISSALLPWSNIVAIVFIFPSSSSNSSFTSFTI